MKTGIELIAQERQEQIEKHGFTLNHDKYNAYGELKQVSRYLLSHGVSSGYPGRWSSEYKHKLDGKSEVEKLIIAGALIAAEIDRLNQPPATV